MQKVPNEKLIETLFNYNALRFLEAEKVTLYTPSTREEFVNGYDAKLMGVSGFDELYIQFKTPALRLYDGRAVKLTEHQHDRLRAYPAKTAYYVTHTFQELVQIQVLQRKATSPVDFLRRFFAIECGLFEEDTAWFRYTVYDPDSGPEEIMHRRHSDGRIKKYPHSLRDENGWMNGEDLLRRFARGEIGARVRLVGSGEFAGKQAMAPTLMDDQCGEIWVMSPDIAWEMAPPEQETNWGTAFRKDALPKS